MILTAATAAYFCCADKIVSYITTGQFVTDKTSTSAVAWQVKSFICVHNIHEIGIGKGLIFLLASSFHCNRTNRAWPAAVYKNIMEVIELQYVYIYIIFYACFFTFIWMRKGAQNCMPIWRVKLPELKLSPEPTQKITLFGAVLCINLLW